MGLFSFSHVVTVIFVGFLCYSCYNIYSIFNPSQCSSNANQQCLVPAYENARELELWVYTSNKLAPSNQKDMDILLRKPLRRGDNFTEQINVTLPSKTLHSGTLYAHVYLGPRGKHPVQHQQHVAAATVPMTRYSVPEVTAFNLLSGENQNSSHGQPLTHWIPTLSIHSLSEDWKFDRMLLPGDLWRSIFLVPGTSQYLPILYVDRMKTTTADLKVERREGGAKSWYSFIIHTLVNGVYAFGFIFMLPQLFVNYKMKSVAHLPWRAFMYKAFNTFIDDVFAFMIVMPTSHRIAVFRDDLVFLVPVPEMTVTDVLVNPPRPGEPSYKTFQEECGSVLSALRRKAKLVTEGFNAVPGVYCNEVQGAMYAFPKINIPAAAQADAEANNMQLDKYYCLMFLRETGVCVVPGSGFRQIPGTWHFRTTILSPEDIKLLLQRFAQFHTNFVQRYSR